MQTKNKLKIGICILLLGTFMSCSNGAQTEKTGDKEYYSAYVCPMHCEGSGSSKEGQCPECKMDYVKNDLHGHAEELVHD